MKNIINSILLSIILFALTVPSYAVTQSEHNAGLIFQDQKGQSFSAPLLESHVNMKVNGLINRVTVKQVFKNKSDQWINASYLYPLPDKSAVDHLRLNIGDRVIEGEIKPIEQAKRLYKKALKSGKKATLLSQQRSNIFTTNVANIAPFETVVIEIEYQELIQYREGEFSLHYPMTITPRYAPAMNTIEEDDFPLYVNKTDKIDEKPLPGFYWFDNWQNHQADNKINEWINLNKNNELAIKTNDVIASKGDPDLLMSINVHISSPIKLQQINSPYHQISNQLVDDGHYLVSLKEAVKANQDFVLNWKVSTGEENNSIFYQENMGDKQYGQLMVLPALSANHDDIDEHVFDKDILFVIDTSGSMSGSSMNQAKAALQYGVDQLNSNDRFNIIKFNDQAQQFSSKFMTATQRNKHIAKTYISQLNASGGTNMDAALSLAISTKPEGEKRLQQIIFITDASISNENALLKKISNELRGQRLFMVGIGSAPNRYFMTRSAELGKGTYTYIGRVEEVKDKISSLFTKISSPVLQQINITWEDGTVVEHWPKAVGDLYQSEPIQVVMEIPKIHQGQSLKLTGYQLKNGKNSSWTKILKTNENPTANGISQLLAREQVASISLDLNIKEDQKKALITKLGMNHHMVTKYTSLVAIDKTPVRAMHLSSSDKQVKSMLPKGSEQRLPQTGFASDWLMKQGLLMLLIGLVLLIIKRKGQWFSTQ